MLKERGVAPFSKWDKELPKIVFDPRFKAIPSHSARRALFEHYVRTRAEEERKEKRAAQRAAVEGFKQLLEEAKEVWRSCVLLKILIATLIIKHLRANGERIHDLRSCPGKKESFC
ncbi:pre-mRNA-processing protein 40C-like isoform X3 [Olea europaea var. sylvestris]|uniref:pre-mRNA-processing protein 40C-like isoform X3 n=1 Tax=Olea europaea var. sylvestris TaxID=158386 RepID=UPI000C1D6E0A|nr:pre-mRNA-processing protein 40C-like isoform X3 [Olea europaea var. sylvestris]